MYAHNTAVPNRMIDIYSDSRMIAKEKKHPWDTLHKEGVPPVFDNSGFMLFSFVVAFLPYGVGNRLPNLPV